MLNGIRVKKTTDSIPIIGSIMNKYFTHYLFTLTFSMLSIAAAPVHASKYQTPSSIKQAVNNFLSLEANIKNFSIGRIDKRLRLKSCPNHLDVNFPQYAEQLGRTTVEVKCNSSKSWKMLVTVYIKKYLNIISAKHSLPAGSVIQASDINTSRREISKIRGGYFTNIAQISNMVVRRSIRSGKVLSPTMLKPKRLVSQGDEVLILAETGNLSIRVKGKALMHGTLGQRIKVKNMNSRRIFQATVISNGLVQVNM